MISNLVRRIYNSNRRTEEQAMMTPYLKLTSRVARKTIAVQGRRMHSTSCQMVDLPETITKQLKPMLNRYSSKMIWIRMVKSMFS